MNAHEKMAARIAYKVACEIIGGLENCLTDFPSDCEEYQSAKEMLNQSKSELVDYLYTEVMAETEANGDWRKHMRFAGTEFVRTYLDKLLTKWGYKDSKASEEKENKAMKYEVIETVNGEFAVVEAGTNNVYKTYTRKDSARKAANRLNEKNQPATEEQPKVEEPQEEPKTEEQLAAETDTVKVELRAFTGMVLGTYEAQKTSKGFKVVVKSGKTLNFNKDGEQLGIKNYKFANRIVFC